jgi:hypothetical protein
VDVAMDSVYKTPVFRTKAGQSSCPWEPGTANREGTEPATGIQGSQFTAVNVPANEPAVFKMNLGNLSATNEDWTYGFTAIASNNPDGAVIKLNGQQLNNNTIKYIVPYGTSYPYHPYRGARAGGVRIRQPAWSRWYPSVNSQLRLLVTLAGDQISSRGFTSAWISSARAARWINVPEQNWVVLNDPDPARNGPAHHRIGLRPEFHRFPTGAGAVPPLRRRRRLDQHSGTF